jgi:peptide/nickel transport system ATP-binding protein/oligopeptide transport system ATP-binding protein
MTDPLLRVRDLQVHFKGRDALRSTIKAVDGVSFDLAAGRTLALVGESGCGKSTTAYAIVGLEFPTAGSIHFAGQDISRLDPKARRALATEMAIVFQDPSAALDPKMSVADSILEPLAIQGRSREEQRRRLAELLDRVGLPAAYATRTPNALSGGQKQRVVIARALALSPRLLVLDEPVSALDVSIRSQILNLLMELQRDLGLAYLFISHDLSVVRHVADETMVMYLGTVAEQGETDALFREARHPYTQALLSAIPLPDPVAQRKREKIILTGDLPSPLAPPPGCRFASRCPIRVDQCTQVRPILEAADAGVLLSTACIVRAPSPDRTVATS